MPTIRTHRFLRGASALALLQILIISLPNSSANASSTPIGPTLSQLITDVVASSHAKHGPNVFTSLPTLSQAGGDGTVAMIPAPCISSTTAVKQLPSNAGKTCAFGDTHSTKTLLLFGDSQASTWLPAFNVAGELMRWRIIFLAKDGCGPWISPVTSIQGSSACNLWVRGEIAIANQLKPQVVVPVGLTLSLLSNNQYPTISQFVFEFQMMVKAIAPSHGKLLLLQEVPQFYSYITSATPTSCLTVHSSSIQSCELKVKQVKSIETTLGLSAVAKTDHLETVPIRELFCGKVRCDVFVNSPGESHLIYQDWAHMDATYSVWIGRATAQLIAKDLPH